MSNPIGAFLISLGMSISTTYKQLSGSGSFSNMDEESGFIRYRESRKPSKRFLYPIFALVVIVAALSTTFFVISHSIAHHYTDGEPVEGNKGAVATEHELCSNIGIDILKKGGNAVDSAIASAICIGTVNCFSSGIGGGGFMMIRLPNGTAEMIDFRETAPRAATEGMYAKDPKLSQIGGLSVAVPGEIRGFELAHKRYGELAWKELFLPSINIARNGYKVSRTMAGRLKEIEDLVLRDEQFGSVFSNNGRLLVEGDTVKREKFAKALEAIAESGADAFYGGWIADDILETIRESKGILTRQDLAEYRPKIKEPVVGFYHGRKIISSPLPSSGAVLVSILNILEGYNFAESGRSLVNVHRLIEAFKHAYAERTELGDSDYLNIHERLKEIISKDYAALRRANISDTQTFPVQYYQPKFEQKEMPGTTHLSIVDESRMAVAVTSTINLSFGSKLMTKRGNIILNNEMDDFSSPNITNAFGLPPSPSNFIRPGKRPMSSTTPTIIEYNGKLDMVIGASGGSMITTSTAQTILNVLDFKMDIQKAINAPRIHHQLIANNVYYEAGVDKTELEYLKSLGHEIMPRFSIADVQGIKVLSSGTLQAGADLRKGGRAAAY